MTQQTPDLTSLRWSREVEGIWYEVSTSREKLDLDFINEAFDTEDMPWAKPLSRNELSKTLDHSLTIGLYAALPCMEGGTSDEPSSPRTPSPTLQDSDEVQYKQIGLARLITDHVTFAYLTDVFVAPTHRRSGLARWLMECTREVIERHPAIRRVMCVTNLPYGVDFYRETLDMHNINDEAPLLALTRRFGADWMKKS